MAASICVGCHGELLTHPSPLREMTQYKDTRPRGGVCPHALIQSCLLQAQLCLNEKTKETPPHGPPPVSPEISVKGIA